MPSRKILLGKFKNLKFKNMAALTREQVINLLKTNAIFALGFAIDNNYDEIKSNIYARFGYNAISQIKLKEYIIAKLKTLDSADAIKAVTSAKYLNEKSDYTGGYADFFNVAMPTSGMRGTFWNSLFTGLGAGLTAFSASQTAAAGATGGATGAITPEALAAMQKAEEERLAAEAAAKKKKIITIVLISIAVLVVGIVIWKMSKKK